MSALAKLQFIESKKVPYIPVYQTKSRGVGRQEIHGKNRGMELRWRFFFNRNHPTFLLLRLQPFKKATVNKTIFNYVYIIIIF